MANKSQSPSLLSKEIVENIWEGESQQKTLCIIKRQIDKSKCDEGDNGDGWVFRWQYPPHPDFSLPFPLSFSGRWKFSQRHNRTRNQCNWRTHCHWLGKWVKESCRLLWQQLFRGARHRFPFFPPSFPCAIVCLSTQLHGNFRWVVAIFPPTELASVFVIISYARLWIAFEMFACHLRWQ